MTIENQTSPKSLINLQRISLSAGRCGPPLETNWAGKQSTSCHNFHQKNTTCGIKQSSTHKTHTHWIHIFLHFVLLSLIIRNRETQPVKRQVFGQRVTHFMLSSPQPTCKINAVNIMSLYYPKSKIPVLSRQPTLLNLPMCL